MQQHLRYIFICFLFFFLLTHSKHIHKNSKQILASLPPISHPSQSSSVTPRPARTDYVYLEFSSEYSVIEDRFDSFGTSFFEYFGLVSVVNIDDDDEGEPEGDDDEFLFGDDDDGRDDDGADDDDEEVEFNDVGLGNIIELSLLLQLSIFLFFMYLF